MTPALSFRFWSITCLLTFPLVAKLGAETQSAPSFVSTLSAENVAATGMRHLTPAQRATLDRLVQHEIKLARDGDVVAFAGTFYSRRTPDERAAAGLDTLTPAERDRLDVQIAKEIAQRPVPVNLVSPLRPSSSGLNAVQVSSPVQSEVHGSVTLTYGAGNGGSSFYGGEMDLNYVDPAHKFSAEISYAEFHGRGIGFAGPRCGWRE